MTLREMPTLMASSYVSNTIDPAQVMYGGIGALNASQSAADDWSNLVHQARLQQNVFRPVQPPQKETTVMTNPSRRLVQVFIVDPDENVPLADCLLYDGKPKLTDLTDQELFFEIDIKSVLDAHNEKRVKFVDKKVKERTEHLGPARVRDLKMTVVSIATF